LFRTGAPNHLLADVSGNLVLDPGFEVFSHAFYNFMPDEDWTFDQDGEYPVPA
jgi:hypothetical protein